uniref:H15 domain-containing protein n=1 Tax=Trichuris muris TaxID=70415 RepID=A0A5S6QTR5_TRIMR
MSTPEAAAPSTPTKKVQAGGTKKARGPAKPKPASNHPAYSEMVTAALRALKQHNGSSRQALLKYIMAHYQVGSDMKMINAHIKTALKRGVAMGALKLTKGTGAAGRFRVDEPKATGTKAKKPKVVKKKSAASPAKPRAKKAVASGAGGSAAKTKKAKKPKASKPKAAGAAKPKKSPKAAKPKVAKKPKSPKAKKQAAAKPKKAAVKKTA